MKLRVRARGSALVPDIEAMEGASVRRFIGRRLDPNQGVSYVDDAGVKRQQAAFAPIPGADGTVEVPARAEYAQSVKDGDLWAADEATAKYCSVTFDSKFGEEPKAKETSK